MNNLIQGDCLEVLPTLESNSINAIITDPPYGISFMGKKWDIEVPSVEIFKECLRVLKPGGHLLCFAGTRTYHRMAVNIETAGFEVRDMISWVYGSGFPKALDVSKKIDELKGAEREVIREYEYPDGKKRTALTKPIENVMTPRIANVKPHRDITAPATPEAKQWEGWKSALKPAFEPICLARKPLSENSIAENVLKHGTGALNIDGCRVETEDNLNGGAYSNNREKSTNEVYGKYNRIKEEFNQPKGRYPANFIHSGCEEVERLFPNTTSGNGNIKTALHKADKGNTFKYSNDFETITNFGDSGSASRFFKVCQYDQDDLNEFNRFAYIPKASKEDRDEGLRGFDKKQKIFNGQSENSSIDIKDVEKRFTTKPKSNHHPTVKPTDLMRYLCRMITPPGGVVLDPFMGSGSTGKGAALEGFQFIGIEMDNEYFKIAQARIKSAQAKGHQTTMF